MKAAAFFVGFAIVLIGVEPDPATPIWMILPVITTGLAMIWWAILPQTPKNRYRK